VSGIARDDAVEQAEMGGDDVSDLAARRGGEKDPPSGGALCAARTR
jgi:hypothetical protein